MGWNPVSADIAYKYDMGIPLTRAEFDLMFDTANSGFNLLPADVQQALLANPAQWAKGNMAFNPENNSYLSIGAEGGYNEDAYRYAQWDPNQGLLLDPNAYLQVHDDEWYENPVAALGLGSAGFGVGGTTGAALATGNTDNIPQTLALDAAGLAAGYGLAGAGLGTTAGGNAAVGGTGYDAFAANDPLGFMLQQAEGFGVPGELTAAAEMAGYPSVEAYLGAVNPAWAAAGGAALGGTAGATLGGAASAAGAGSLLSGLGDVLKGAKEYLPSGNTAAALAPIIAAIAYAKNQGPFDTSRLTSTYDQFEPDALAYEFDQNTNAGRNALTSSLTNRGVMGSSFGNMDLTNFQTTRDLGRRSLVNQGLAVRGGLANNILEAQVKERQLKNQLYGTSLLALGNVFGGRNNQGAP